jgi:hypothetical protein
MNETGILFEITKLPVAAWNIKAPTNVASINLLVGLPSPLLEEARENNTLSIDVKKLA